MRATVVQPSRRWHCLRDRAPLTITGRVQLKFREWVTYPLARDKTEKLCVAGHLFGNETVFFSY